MANPVVAAILSFFIPGLGQFYDGHLMRGLFIFLFFVFIDACILLLFLPFFFVLGILPFLFWVWNIWDAYKLAN